MKELAHVIPSAKKLTRGKAGFDVFLEEAQSMNATRLLLVGGFHGNPGRLGFLHNQDQGWAFLPPTIILKTVTLLREHQQPAPRPPKQLYVMPDTKKDFVHAESLAKALGVTCVEREDLPVHAHRAALLRVALRQRSSLEFVSIKEDQLLGPSLLIKRFLQKPMGDMKRW